MERDTYNLNGLPAGSPDFRMVLFLIHNLLSNQGNFRIFKLTITKVKLFETQNCFVNNKKIP
jgi:hypothetical protein